MSEAEVKLHDEGRPAVLRPPVPRRRRAAARRAGGDTGIIAGTGAVLLIAWYALTTSGSIPKIILPAPAGVLQGLEDMFTNGTFAQNFLPSLEEYLLGFALGSGISLALGVLMVNVRLLRRIFYPYLAAFNSVPRVALGPLFVTWFGLGIMSKVWLSAAICFFPVLVNTVLGLESVEENAVLLMRSLAATRWQVFRKLAWPSALPSIFAGLETSATLALIGAVVGEEVGAKNGLMVVLENYNSQLQTGGTFAVLIVLSILGLLLFSLLTFVDQRLVFWRQHGR